MANSVCARLLIYPVLYFLPPATEDQEDSLTDATSTDVPSDGDSESNSEGMFDALFAPSHGASGAGTAWYHCG